MSNSIRVLILILVAGALSGCKNDSGDRLPGYVEGEFVYVSAPTSGKLQALHVTRGTEVQQDAALFEIEAVPQRMQRDAAEARFNQAQATVRDTRKGQRPTELDALQAQHQQAIAALRMAEAELLRQQKLISSGVGGSQQDVDRAHSTRDQATEQVAMLAAQLKTARLGARTDQVSAAQANVDSLQAQLKQAEWELSQTQQNAPAAGVVADTLYRQGEFVAAGHPIVVLLPPTNIKVRTFVPETSLSSLRVGQSANVHVDGIVEPLPGRVSFISPRMEFTPPVIYTQATRSKFVALVEITFEPVVAATLHPGQPVEVAFNK